MKSKRFFRFYGVLPADGCPAQPGIFVPVGMLLRNKISSKLNNTDFRTSVHFTSDIIGINTPLIFYYRFNATRLIIVTAFTIIAMLTPLDFVLCS